jgi:hypothetical protein
MPSEYQIDVANRLVRARAWGVLTHDDLMATLLGIRNDPAFKSDFSQLYDFREALPSPISAAKVRDLASYSNFGAGSRRALVAANDAIYGLLRMYAAHREAIGREQIAVFRSLADAQAWLQSKDRLFDSHTDSAV